MINFFVPLPAHVSPALRRAVREPSFMVMLLMQPASSSTSKLLAFHLPHRKFFIADQHSIHHESIRIEGAGLITLLFAVQIPSSLNNFINSRLRPAAILLGETSFLFLRNFTRITVLSSIAPNKRTNIWMRPP